MKLRKSIRSKILNFLVIGFALVFYQNCGEFQSQSIDPSSGGFNSASFKCNPSAVPGERSLRRLTKSQLTATLVDLFGQGLVDNTQVQTALESHPVDGSEGIYSTFTQSVSERHISSFFLIAEIVGKTIAESSNWRTSVLGSCGNAVDRTCVDSFIHEKR